MDRLLVVDIGTSNIRAAVAAVTDRGLDVMGLSSAPSDGMDRGVIVDLEAVAARIADAVTEARIKAGGRIRSATVCGNFGFLSGFNSQGSTAITGGRRGVTEDDIAKALTRARQRKVPEDMQIVQTITRGFRVDETPNILEPLGLAGHLLEVDAHLLALKESALDNLRRCLLRSQLALDGVIPSPLACGLASLSDEERENGVAVVDIGGGTTSISVYFEGQLQLTGSLPVGGHHFTRDLARAFSSSLETAEKLKRGDASAVERPDRAEEEVRIERLPPRKPAVATRGVVDYVVAARAEQVLNEFMRFLREHRATNLLFSGVVLTGGSSNLQGLAERFESQLGINARIGSVTDPRIVSEQMRGAEYATLAGGLLHAAERRVLERKRLGTGWTAAVRAVGAFAARCFAQFV